MSEPSILSARPPCKLGDRYCESAGYVVRNIEEVALLFADLPCSSCNEYKAWRRPTRDVATMAAWYMLVMRSLTAADQAMNEDSRHPVDTACMSQLS
jgi:hypothetical protein